MLRTNGSKILSQLSIPQFGKIFVLLLKLDNLQPNDERKWPTIFSDLIALVQSTEDVELQKLYIRFIIKTLQIFDEELVERYSSKPPAEVILSSQIKDFVRDGQIGPIVTVLLQVVANYNLFPKKTVKGTLKVLAQLIDWNELNFF